MSMPPAPDPNPFAVLRKFVRPRPASERCELCGQGLSPKHPHLLELARRRIVCSCGSCAVLFSGQESARYRRVPRTVSALPDFPLTDAQWDRLGIPIGLAFFFHNSHTGRAAAIYPSPAGATEALLPLEAWPELVEAHPALSKLEPDVEALLVNRVGGAGDYFLAPIDECYRLVGLIRANWRGLAGGAEVWGAVRAFFAGLRERAAERRDDA